MSVQSEISKASIFTQKLLEEVALLNNTKIQKVQTIINDETLNKSWTGLGKYIFKNLKIGRAVNVPRLGLFTFQAPQVNLQGTTNQNKRDTQNREAIFFVSNEFAKGVQLQPAIVTLQGLRPITISSTAGQIQTIICNFCDIAMEQNLEKDKVKIAIERIVKKLDQKIRKNLGSEIFLMEIPFIGVFIVKNELAAVFFHQHLKNQVKNIFQKSMSERKNLVNEGLTQSKLQQLEKKHRDFRSVGSVVQDIFVNKDANIWLNQNLDIDVDQLQTRNNFYSNRKVNENNQIQNKGNLLIKGLDLVSGKQSNQSKQNGIKKFFKNQISKEYEKEKEIKEKNLDYQAFSIEFLTFKKFKQTLNLNANNAERIFQDMITMIYGISSQNQNEISREQFSYLLKNYKVNLFDFEEDILFNLLDTTKDGIIDLNEWLQFVCNEKSGKLLLLEELQKCENKLQIFVEKLQISDEAEPVTNKQMKQKIQNINSSLSQNENARLAKHIMKSQDILYPREIKQNLESIFKLEFNKGEDNQKNKMQQFYQNFLMTIKRFFIEKFASMDPLIKLFQKEDQSQQGIVDIGGFQEIILKLNLGFSLGEIIKFSKLVERNYLDQIDYERFVKKIKHFERNQVGLEQIAEKIKQVCKCKRLDGKELLFFLTENKDLRKLFNINHEDRTKLSVNVFKKVLASTVFSKDCEESIYQQTHLIDIDKDGFIDQYDIETFLKRYNFIEKQLDNEKEENYQIIQKQNNKNQFLEQQDQKQYQQIKTEIYLPQNEKEINQSQSQSESLIQKQKLITQRLYPTAPLSTDKVQKLIKEFQQILIRSKLPLIEVFKILDQNNDGFVTIHEFEIGIEKIMKISDTARDGLFAFFDSLKIGMFDLHRFIYVMSRLTFDDNQKFVQDSWEWQKNIIEQWKIWFKEQNISIADAFSIADADFDGYLSKQDIKHFLANNLKIRQTELENQTNIDRLFKMLDFYKKGIVQKIDLQKILLGGNNNTNIFFLNDNTINKENKQKSEISQGMKSLSNRGSQNKNLEIVQNLNAYYNTNNYLHIGKQNLKSYSKSKSELQSSNFSQNQAYNKNDLIFNKVLNNSVFNNLDWIENAKQQISKMILKKYNNLKESFEQISKHSGMVYYKEFKQFINENVILDGFSLTDQLLQRFFSTVDQHNKGFLSLNDWLKAFGGFYSEKEVAINHIVDMIEVNFKNKQQVINFFVENNSQQIQQQKFEMQQYKGNNFISFQMFQKGINNLFAENTYNNKILQQVWEHVKEDKQNQTLDFQQFVKIFCPNLQQSVSQQSIQKLKSQNSTPKFMQKAKLIFNGQERSASSEKISSLISSNKSQSLVKDKVKKKNSEQEYFILIEKFNERLFASGKDLMQAFESIDNNQSGFVSQIELKNLIQKLNLGLNYNEICQIIFYSQLNIDKEDEKQRDGLVQWRKFMKKIQINEQTQQLVKRSENRIKKLRDDLYQYLISPKDAFREFDKKKKGYIVFTEFRQILTHLSNLQINNDNNVPNYNVCKDMFDFIDIKKDGLIDLDEWNQCFGIYDCQFEKHEKNILDRKQSLQQKNKSQNDIQFQIDDIEKNQIYFQKGNYQKKINKIQSCYSSGKREKNSCNGIDLFKNVQGIPIKWERTTQYDKVIKLIGKNRKNLLEEFNKAAIDEENKFFNIGLEESKYLKPSTCKKILEEHLFKNSISIYEKNWQVLMNYSMKKGLIDYRMLLDVYKQRLDNLDSHPSQSIVTFN